MSDDREAQYMQQIEEAQKKLHIAISRLAEIERIKAQEPIVRREIATLEEQIEEWQGELSFHYTPPDKGDAGGPQSEAQASFKPIPRADLFKSEDEQKVDERKKRMKALNKKLQQIDKLKEKPLAELDPEAKAKVQSEAQVKEELAALERGEDYDSSKKAPGPSWAEHGKQAASAQLPTDEAERTKMLRGLKKKLQQIDGLKARDGALDPDARAKVASEHRILQEVAALERGDAEVVYEDPPELSHGEQLTADKIDLERRVKNVTKKIDQIEALKQAGRELSAEEKTKVSNEAALKKERHDLQMEIGKINQKERDRVAERLGWQGGEDNGAKGKKKNNK